MELNRMTTSLLGVAADVLHAVTTSGKTNEVPRIRQDPAPFRELMPQQIIGINNLKQISWIETGLGAAKSVCRILTPNGFGTGFLVADDVVMTNNHVIGSTDLAAASQAEFDYQQDRSGGFLPSVRYGLISDGFHTNADLDYSLVRVRSDVRKPPLRTWGVLLLNANADPTPSEHVIIVQHPNGGYKQIVLTANWVIAAKPPVL